MSKTTRAQYYEKAFERLEKENKHTWNWAAFFLDINWMLFRKLYLYVVIYLIGAFGIVAFAFSMFREELQGCEYGIFFALALNLVPRLFLGRFGNYLYYRSVKKRISKGYHLLEKYSPTSVASVVFNILSSGIICFADYISRKLQLKNCADKNITVDEDSIRKYLNPNRKKHWVVKTANTLIFIIWLLCMLTMAIGKIAEGVQQKLLEQQAATQVITQESDTDSL